ncbi:hypothetical protein AB0K48_49240 [Nonomuraea sp. NPDC055795]
MQVIISGEPLRYGLRLVAYQPNGARLWVLGQHLGLEASMPLNDMSSLRLTYYGLAQGAAWLESPCEVAVEYSTGGGWTEPANARFLRIKRSGEDTDRSAARAYQMPGYTWMLTKLILYAGTGGLVDGKRQFAAATPGDILAAFVGEGQARGALPGLAVDFTVTHDSVGQAWNKTLTIGLDVGVNLQAVLINLSEQGICDWQMSGRTLQVYNEGTALARQLAAGPAPVDLRLGRDVDQAPDEATLEDAASVILIAGEDNLRVEVSNPAATVPWGRWETYQQQGGVSDHGTATLLGQHALERVARERVQLTRQLVFGAARWLPLAGYRVGDHVLAPATPPPCKTCAFARSRCRAPLMASSTATWYSTIAFWSGPSGWLALRTASLTATPARTGPAASRPARMASASSLTSTWTSTGGRAGRSPPRGRR